MQDPARFGGILSGWLGDLGLSQTVFARHLGVSRSMLSRILHEHAAITADMDLRLSEALGTSLGYCRATRSPRRPDINTCDLVPKIHRKRNTR
jgi:addiction module HigA family antidote